MSQTSETNVLISNRKNILLWGGIFSVVVVMLLLAASIIAIFMYRKSIGVDISSNPEEWSYFGSFFGGLFSPLISFATLLVLIITVYLQWEIISTQRKEFAALNDLQNEQLTQSKGMAEFEKVASYKQTIIHVLTQQIQVFQEKIQGMTHTLYELKKIKDDLEVDSSGIDQVEELRNHKNELMSSINELSRFIVIYSNLSIEIAIKQFNSMEEVREHFQSELIKAK